MSNDQQLFLQAFASQGLGRRAKSGVGRKQATTDAFLGDQATARGNGADLLASRLTIGLVGFLSSTRPDTLKPALQAAPMVAQQAIWPENTASEEQERRKTNRWRFGGGYGTAAYNPNVDFATTSGSALAYSSPANGPATSAPNNYVRQPNTNETRPRFRDGVAQRVVLTARYALNKRWTVGSGVELAQQHASASTQYAYLDGRSTPASDYLLYNNSNSATTQTKQTTRYRYNTASIPVTLHYGSPKTGMSFYAKVGGAVGVLFGSRSTLEGNAGFTRTYDLADADSPYRKVLASARTGAGVRYRPADSTWSLALGPTAEGGLNTLNRNPARSSARPYSVGVEASIEFGGAKGAVSR